MFLDNNSDEKKCYLIAKKDNNCKTILKLMNVYVFLDYLF